MSAVAPDLSIFEQFGFERPPVGLKFSRTQPEGMPLLGRRIALCEALAEAHKGEAFVYSAADEVCAGSLPLGNEEIGPPFAAGEVGPVLGVFKEARANRRIYEGLPKLDPGTARYIAFAPLGKFAFDPDVLTVTATPSQAEVILRASVYTVGGVYESRMTPVLGCAWLFVYPFISGKLQLHDDGARLGHEGPRRTAAGAGAAVHPLRPAADGRGEPRGHGLDPARVLRRQRWLRQALHRGGTGARRRLDAQATVCPGSNWTLLHGTPMWLTQAQEAFGDVQLRSGLVIR